MKNHKRKKKVLFEKYKPNELVVVSAGMHYYSPVWAREHGLLNNTGKYFTKDTVGKYIKTSAESGSLYKVIDINGELFEVFHIHVKRINHV